jgi:hypothetical protein
VLTEKKLFPDLILPNIACSNASNRGKKQMKSALKNCHLGRLRRQTVVRKMPSLVKGVRGITPG